MRASWLRWEGIGRSFLGYFAVGTAALRGPRATLELAREISGDAATRTQHCLGSHVTLACAAMPLLPRPLPTTLGSSPTVADFFRALALLPGVAAGGAAFVAAVRVVALRMVALRVVARRGAHGGGPIGLRSPGRPSLQACAGSHTAPQA